MDKQKLYESLIEVSKKLEQFISKFHNTFGFNWYEGHLQKIVHDIREREVLDQWLEGRKEAGKLIDPITAESRWEYGQVLDPYGVTGVSPDAYCIGRNYFFRNPDSNIWVWEGDLPEATRERIRARKVADKTSDDEFPF